MAKYLDENGLLYYNQKLNEKFNTKVDKITGKGLSTNDFTTELKTKLDGIETGATKVTIDSALSGTSTNPVQNAVVKNALDNKVDVVSGKGLSTNDFTTAYKDKLDGIEAGANKTVVDEELSDSSSNPVENKAVKAALDGKVDVETGKGLSTNDYTTTEKTKLAGIESGAEVNDITDVKVNNESVVTDKIANIDLTGYVEKEDGKGLSSNDYTTTEKTKLAGIETGATKTVIDATLSTSSTNPVQNKVVKDALDNKVDVVSGKGLSTNDFTNAYKTKLDGIESGAEVNVIESIKINGTTATISGKEASITIEAGKIDEIKVNGVTQEIVDKAVDITVPTKTSDLTNDSSFQNATQVQSAINTAISGITQFDYQVVATLPTTGVKGTIYLVPNSGTSPNFYDEYIWIVPQGQSGKWEKIGTTEIDLSGYWSKSELVAITNSEIDTILAN